MRLAVIVAIFASVVAAQTPKPDPKAEPKAKELTREQLESAIAKAAFSATDPAESLRWMTRLHRAYLAGTGKGNALADETARKKFDQDINAHANKAVEWPVKVQKIELSHVSFRPVAEVPRADLDDEKRVLVVSAIPVEGMSDADRKFVESLKPGDEIVLRGVVKSVTAAKFVDRDGNAIPKDYGFSVVLFKTKPTPKKRTD